MNSRMRTLGALAGFGAVVTNVISSPLATAALIALPFEDVPVPDDRSVIGGRGCRGRGAAVPRPIPRGTPPVTTCTVPESIHVRIWSRSALARSSSPVELRMTRR